MIYLGFIFDYFINTFLPINSYLVINNIDNNNIFSILVIGIILDTLFGHIVWNLLILLILYIISKKIKTKKKYLLAKNIIIYSIYFIIMNYPFYNNIIIIDYTISLVIEIIFFYLSNMLLNNKPLHIM